jgi:hypothetical protein
VYDYADLLKSNRDICKVQFMIMGLIQESFL